MKSGKKPKFGFANPGIENPETKKPYAISKKKSAINPYNSEYLLDIFVLWLNLRICGLSDGFWGTKRRMGLGAEDGGWILVLVESPDLGVLGWVLGNIGEDGGWVLVWGVKRVGWECYVMEWGVKGIFLLKNDSKLVF